MKSESVIMVGLVLAEIIGYDSLCELDLLHGILKNRWLIAAGKHFIERAKQK